MMTTYSLTLSGVNKQISEGKLGGNKAKNPYGESFGFTNFYMTWNEEPIVPVVGEFHFTRFSYLHWEEELLKMKAGGVQVIATYVFWNYHEEEEGVFAGMKTEIFVILLIYVPSISSHSLLELDRFVTVRCETAVYRIGFSISL